MDFSIILQTWIGVSEKSLPFIKREIQEFKLRIADLVDEDRDSNMVYNINVQVFPVSETEQATDKKGDIQDEA